MIIGKFLSKMIANTHYLDFQRMLMVFSKMVQEKLKKRVVVAVQALLPHLHTLISKLSDSFGPASHRFLLHTSSSLTHICFKPKQRLIDSSRESCRKTMKLYSKVRYNRRHQYRLLAAKTQKIMFKLRYKSRLNAFAQKDTTK